MFTLPSFKFRALVLPGNRIIFPVIGQSEMSFYVIYWAQYVIVKPTTSFTLISLLLAPYWSAYVGYNGIL